ncbi:MAG: hypothetical protein IJB80_05290 [Clostridia bacterium]|nr:hypothetical protein [Clostridia bacterium]
MAKAIYKAAKALSPDNLSGRTIDGIDKELQIHWAFYRAGVMKENTKDTNIGGMRAPGKDGNAWTFETLQRMVDIHNPSMAKKIWRVLER